MWELVNQTPYAAERGFVRDHDGGEVWIVLVKATFDLSPDGNLQPAAEQPPVDLEPVYRDSPAGLYLRRDTALIPTKPGTEVLIEGSACAPGGRIPARAAPQTPACSRGPTLALRIQRPGAQ